MNQIQLSPMGTMDLLSKLEVERLRASASGKLYQLYRNCSLAVLNVGQDIDDCTIIFERNKEFGIDIISKGRGVKLQLTNAPQHAFVDGRIILGIQEHLFSVLRDIVYVSAEYDQHCFINLTDSTHITHMVFDILRNAKTIQANSETNMIVCWGGHSINRVEYEYTKDVGYELGLRGLNICTGCGPGAMKGPMKGAAIGHVKQRISNGRYIGLTEPSIIAAEPPNPIVNELVILPDIEKRLEAFVRIGHGIVIFAGGVGTAEELLYLLGILLHPDNANQQLPVVLTGPKESEPYFQELNKFILATLGTEATDKYQIIIDDPASVAQYMRDGMKRVRESRKSMSDAYHFNWELKITEDFQMPFIPNHQSMKALDLHLDQPKEKLAANLRRAFSGIVAGNVKVDGINEIKQHGPFQLNGDPTLMAMLDELLAAFVSQQRMKLPGTQYQPCYEIVSG